MAPEGVNVVGLWPQTALQCKAMVAPDGVAVKETVVAAGDIDVVRRCWTHTASLSQGGGGHIWCRCREGGGDYGWRHSVATDDAVEGA